MRISVNYRGTAEIYDIASADVIVGRTDQENVVDLDLTPDQAVSRVHARISTDGSQFWIEDLNSRKGTLLSGAEIRGQGKRQLEPGEPFRIGRTTLVIEASSQGTMTAEEPAGEIGQMLDAALPVQPIHDATADIRKRLKLFYDLPLEFAQEARLDTALRGILERIAAVVPGAARGALFLRNPGSDELLLCAHVPRGNPAISFELARRAMDKQQAFTWNQGEDDASPSIRMQNIASAMYAPLLWKGKALGILCVDNCKTCGAFTSHDLELITAVAQLTGIAVAVHQTQEDLRETAVLLSRLLTSFSPRIRTRLLEKARRGNLRPGGEKSEVTILFSDIRGFTRMSAGMEAEEVVEMLNAYFPALVEPIFRNDGSIDKFVGDAILAVFGSPEADARQHEKAVRAAIGMQEAMDEMNRMRQTRGEPTCGIGVGVHSGEVLHGFIGTAERMEFTVIGDAVNVASRYCSAAAAGEVLISSEVFRVVWKLIHAEARTISTKHEGPLEAYCVTGLRTA
jgi:adenylate cyclase